MDDALEPDAIVGDDLPAIDARGSEAGRPDHDGDGLCDTTESVYGTDPDSPDTDADGLLDSFEIDAFTSPLSAAEPRSDARVTLREEPGSRTQTFLAFAYRGVGESLTGVMLDRASGPDGRNASELAAAFDALTADPRAAVADLIGPRFTSVDGLVRLRWIITLAWPSAAPPIGCRRAYAGTPAAFAEGRGLVYARSLVIDVMPAQNGALFDAGAADAQGGDDGPAVGPRWPFVARGLCLPRPGTCR